MPLNEGDVVFFCTERRSVGCLRCKITLECVEACPVIYHNGLLALVTKKASGLGLLPAWRVIDQRLARSDTVVRVVARSLQGTGLQLEQYVNYVKSIAASVDASAVEDDVIRLPALSTQPTEHMIDYLCRVGVLPRRPDTFAHPDIWLQDWAAIAKQLDLPGPASRSMSAIRRITPDSLPTHGPEATVCDAAWSDVIARFNRHSSEQLTIAVSPAAMSPPKRSPLKLLSPKQMWSSIKRTFTKPPTHSRTPTGARSTENRKSSASRPDSISPSDSSAGIDCHDKENTPPQSGHSSESAHTTPGTATSTLASQPAKRSLFSEGSGPHSLSQTTEIVVCDATPTTPTSTTQHPLLSRGCVHLSPLPETMDEFRSSKGGFAAFISLGAPAVGKQGDTVDHSFTPNATEKYAVNRRLSIRNTPPEERLERALKAERARMIREKLPFVAEDENRMPTIVAQSKPATRRQSVFGGAKPQASTTSIGVSGLRRSARVNARGSSIASHTQAVL